MRTKLRAGRSLSGALLGGALIALVAPLPLMVLQGTSFAQQAPQPSFEEADRNKDGFVDKSEAAVVPGLSANFEKADRNKDGKLDREEFARSLSMLSGKK
jgi:Ca2+-binding EF-hand superfamily protein